jgi:hypothetical protein
VRTGLRWRAAAPLALAAVAALAGCKQRDDVGTPPCPKVAVLAEAAHLAVFRDGTGRDLTDIKYEADIGRISGECIYKKKNTSVTVDMKLMITAKRGPADRDHIADFVYFVAVVDAQSNILARKEFPGEIEFAPDQAQVVTQEELEEIIQLKKDQPGSDFDVLVGFKLDHEQVERNRAAHGE